MPYNGQYHVSEGYHTGGKYGILSGIMSDWLTISDAAIFTGKSQNTIRKLIRGGTKSGTKVVTKKQKTGNRYRYLIDKASLAFHYQTGTTNDYQTGTTGGTNVVPILQEQIQALHRQLEQKDRQLEEKDKQINELIERQREQNVIVKILQDRLLPGKTEPVVDQIDQDERTDRREQEKAKQAETLISWVWKRVIG